MTSMRRYESFGAFTAVCMVVCDRPRLGDADRRVLADASLFQFQAAARLPGGGISELAVNSALAIIEAAAPKDEVEGALALQMACTHMAATLGAPPTAKASKPCLKSRQRTGRRGPRSMTSFDACCKESMQQIVDADA
jgi:hypothetical protein